MMIVQLTGLSGAGKSTISLIAKKELESRNLRVEIIDGDHYRQNLCKDLGFSEKDRKENISRLGFVAGILAKHNIIVIIAAINPYESSRVSLQSGEAGAKTVWVKCDLDVLKRRDTKGLYKRALLPDTDPDKVHDLSGINDVYEDPIAPDLVINTDSESIPESVNSLVKFILANIHHSVKESYSPSYES